MLTFYEFMRMTMQKLEEKYPNQRPKDLMHKAKKKWLKYEKNPTIEHEQRLSDNFDESKITKLNILKEEDYYVAQMDLVEKKQLKIHLERYKMKEDEIDELLKRLQQINFKFTIKGDGRNFFQNKLQLNYVFDNQKYNVSYYQQNEVWKCRWLSKRNESQIDNLDRILIENICNFINENDDMLPFGFVKFSNLQDTIDQNQDLL